MSIDPTAVVSPDSEIGSRVGVGPFTVIEPGVVIGDGCRIEGHATLKRGLRLGKDVQVFEGAVLGGSPQDLKFEEAESFAEIGDGTIIREFSTVHRSAFEGGTTRMGRGCFLMAYGHVAHDCDIDDQAIIASYAALAGHIRIGTRAFISGGVVIHQFTHIGDLAMVGGGSKINLDVPPYFTVDGVPGRPVGLNLVGLKRAGIDQDEIGKLKKAYRILYRSKLPLQRALENIEGIESIYTRRLIEFIRASKRGICRLRSGSR